MICILLYFILGILLVQIGFPLMDGITSLLLTMLEATKGYFGLKVAQYSAKIQTIHDEEQPTKKPIGFTYEEDLGDEEIL